ncbi:MAG: four helix bundle protein [Candidatus Margulisiibacteriota bacterium]
MSDEFKGFPVYVKALEAVKEINLLCQGVKDKEYYYLKDQIRRASSSVVLNIAEGSGKWTKKDKSNFYRISRGSAFECIAAIDLFEAFQLIEEKQATRLKKELNEIGRDLQALIISVDKRIK